MKKIVKKINQAALFSLLSFLIIGIIFAFRAFFVKADSSQNLSGWMWGGTEEKNDEIINGNETGVGWISLNSSDCDQDGNNFLDVACGGNNQTTPIANYGVNVPLNGGLVTGYGWSENLGWIDFNPQDHCKKAGGYPAASCQDPDGGNGGVSIENFPGKLVGWARAVGISQESVSNNSGGWDGWIKMYDAQIDASGNVTGYAWNQENASGGLGWLNFNGARIKTEGQLLICPDNETIKVGSTLKLTAYYYTNTLALPSCSNASNDVSYTKVDANWVSSDSDIVSILPSTEMASEVNVLGKKKGKVNIEASCSKNGKNLKANALVTVIDDIIPCIGDDSCKIRTCKGNYCYDQCGNKYSGTRNCSWTEQ